MKITEFLQGRDVERQAVTRYISRHDEIFNGHVTREGKELNLDNYAVSVLKEVYPPLKPVTVIKGVAHEEYERVMNELIKTQKEKDELQNRLLETAEQIASANATKILLEDKEKQLEDKSKQIEKLEMEQTALKSNLEKVQEQLDAEKAKSWLDKLFKK